MIHSKIKTRFQITALTRSLRRRGKKIVFTNGCFDILHAGHIRYLRKAGKAGDILIVGLNSDRSVRRLKGNGRPVQRERDRAEILSALEMVHFVTLFHETTPLKLIRAIRPHVLVKGADWPLQKIAGAADVLSWGGRIKRVALLRGRSTTRLIQASR